MKSLKDPRTGQIPREAAMEEYERWQNLKKSGSSDLAEACVARATVVIWAIVSPMNSGQCDNPCACGEVCSPERRNELSGDRVKFQSNYIKDTQY